MQRLRLTQEGLEKLIQKAEKKKEELRQLRLYKSQVAANEGNVWHDNFAFEQTEIQERALIRQINDLQERIETADIISFKKEKESDIVSIGSKVTVQLKTSLNQEEKFTFFITGNFNDEEEDHISINSPIGECIIGKRQGFKGKYTVNGQDIFVKILTVSN